MNEQLTIIPEPQAAAPPGEIRFTVYGRALSAGSKSSWVPIDKRTGQPFRKNDRIVVNTADANPKSREWKSEVKDAARQAYAGRPIEGPLELVVFVFRARPKAHRRKSGQLKPDAPMYSPTIPDATKLVRGIEDAISNAGNIWRDDAQVCRQVVEKLYGEPARVEITIRPLGAER